MKKADKSATSRAKSTKPASKAGGARTKSAKPASKATKSGKADKPTGKASKSEDKAVKATKKAPVKADRRRKPASAEAVAAAEQGDATQEQLEELQPELPLVAVASEAPAGTDDGDDGDDTNDDDDAAPSLSDEERELSSIYGDDLSAPSLAHVEFKDQKTADEDRPMLPEINARDERRKTWEDRRERRRQEREARRAARRDRGGRPQERGPHGSGRPDARPEARPDARPEPRPEHRAEHRPQPPRGERPEPRNDARPEGRAERPASAPAPVAQGSWGSPLVSATAALFAQLRNGQPMPVRQLASMLRKRALIEADPEQVWPALRAELLADERAHRALGLRPRVVHRGRDLFAPGPAALASSGELEAQLAQSVLSISSTTLRGLTAWMAAASPSAFERLIHTYVVATGYRDVEWIKRVDGISYAQAIAPGIERPVLLSARSGSAPIDRRGVGELRVGVEAKGLPFGTLFAASSLSLEAERELERPGRSIYVVCGDALATALIGAGLGVTRTAVTVHLLDEQFLEDLSGLQS